MAVALACATMTSDRGLTTSFRSRSAARAPGRGRAGIELNGSFEARDGEVPFGRAHEMAPSEVGVVGGWVGGAHPRQARRPLGIELDPHA
jgi:hypothetical protein